MSKWGSLKTCEPCVKKGDSVRVGQVIGNSDKYISSPIHSSVSGTVNDVAPMLFAGGIYVTAVEIKTDGKQEIYEGIKPPSFFSHPGIGPRRTWRCWISGSCQAFTPSGQKD